MNYKEIANKLVDAIVETNLSVQGSTDAREKLLVMCVLKKLEDVFLEKIRDIDQVDIKENERE